jgi:hypothetical protein
MICSGDRMSVLRIFPRFFLTVEMTDLMSAKGIVKLADGFFNRTKPYDKSQTIRGL